MGPKMRSQLNLCASFSASIIYHANSNHVDSGNDDKKQYLKRFIHQNLARMKFRAKW